MAKASTKTLALFSFVALLVIAFIGLSTPGITGLLFVKGTAIPLTIAELIGLILINFFVLIMSVTLFILKLTDRL